MTIGAVCDTDLDKDNPIRRIRLFENMRSDQDLEDTGILPFWPITICDDR